MVQPKKKSFKQTIIINLRELELREVKQLFRGHTARKEWSWDLNPDMGVVLQREWLRIHGPSRRDAASWGIDTVDTGHLGVWSRPTSFASQAEA